MPSIQNLLMISFSEDLAPFEINFAVIDASKFVLLDLLMHCMIISVRMSLSILKVFSETTLY